MDKFKVGDKVLKIGTSSPVMTIKGKTAKAGLPSYTIKDSFWTCYWENNGPHWEEVEESKLTIIPSTKQTE